MKWEVSRFSLERLWGMEEAAELTAGGSRLGQPQKWSFDWKAPNPLYRAT